MKETADQEDTKSQNLKIGGIVMFKIQKCPTVGHIHSKSIRISESIKPHRPDGMRWPFSFGFGRAPQSAAALLLRIRLLGENHFLRAIWGQTVPVWQNEFRQSC